VITLVAWLNERATKPPLMQANRMAIEAQQYADGSLRNAQVIESMGMLRDIHARWMLKQREFLRLQAHASEAAGGYQAVSKLLQTTLSSLPAGAGLLAVLAWHAQWRRCDDDHGLGVRRARARAAGAGMSQWQSVVNTRDAWARLDQPAARRA
jgi:ATP-binding cassette subfamily C exporter for protease/lipase